MFHTQFLSIKTWANSLKIPRPQNTCFILKAILPVCISAIVSKSCLMLTRLVQVWGENELEKIEWSGQTLQPSWRKAMCPCTWGYLQQLPRLPALRIIRENRGWRLFAALKTHANPTNQIPAHPLWCSSQDFFGQLLKVKFSKRSRKSDQKKKSVEILYLVAFVPTCKVSLMVISGSLRSEKEHLS